MIGLVKAWRWPQARPAIRIAFARKSAPKPVRMRCCLTVVPALALLILSGVTPTLADETVVLTVTGRIAGPGGATTIDYTMAELERLGFETVVTTTPWTDGPVTFEGVPATALMAAVGASGQTVRASALNDYVADIPVSDFARHQVLFAVRANGAPMQVRDKGPIWIIYPDYAADHARPIVRDRMVWQLRRLDVR